MKKIWSWILKNEGLVIILLVVALIRVPSLFEPYWYGDEGIYLVMGQALKKGLIWYKQMHDNKPPLLYLVATLSGDVMTFRKITAIWNLINIVVIWKLAKEILEKEWVVVLATAIFGLLTSLPWLEGNIANGEIFMILPVSLAMLWLLRALKHENDEQSFFWVGVLFSLGFLFKVPALFDAIAAGIWVVFFQKGSVGKKIKLSTFMILGFALPVLATIAYYFVAGAGWDYLQAAFFKNIGYLASWKTGTVTGNSIGQQSGLLMKGVVAVAMSGGIWVLTRKSKSKSSLVLLWTVFALFGALLSERPYPHYLIQVVAPVALSIGLIAQMPKKKTLIATVITLILVTSAIVKYDFYFYSTGKYYLNFWHLITRQISGEEYRNNFDWKVKRTYELAQYLKEKTVKEDRVFIWGDEPFVYALSERLPVGRYTAAYHILDFGAKEETMKQIISLEPKFIVLLDSETREYKELVDYVTAFYVQVEKIEDAHIYRRVFD